MLHHDCTSEAAVGQAQRRLPWGLALLVLAATVPLHGQTATFGGCPARSAAVEVRRTAQYVPMADGTRLAVDVVLPDPLPRTSRVPAVATFTRYWRARAGQPVGRGDQYWVRHGYAVVNVDIRGTGASFGGWRHPWTDQERQDIGAVLQWITAQPWSDGRIVSTGGSYLGNTAQLAATLGQRSLRAVAPIAFDYDLYTDLGYPGGIRNRLLFEEWAHFVGGLDANASEVSAGGVLSVDGPDGATLLTQAVAEHRANVSVDVATRDVEFRDDTSAAWGATLDAIDLRRFRAQAEADRVPVQGWASWLDAGTANGVLARFLTWRVPQEVIIGPWNHGGRFRTDPFTRADTASAPTSMEQRDAQRCFFDARLADQPARPRHLIRYFTMGENQWHETAVWPPRGLAPHRWYAAADGALTRTAPTATAGSDDYTVQFDATTGRMNRWMTQLAGSAVDYGDRAAADAKLLTYTSEPLPRAFEVTGHPLVSLAMRSSTTDGNLFVYLEAVSPEGRVAYLTDGQLRLSHRREARVRGPLPVPAHRHVRADAAPMEPGTVTRVRVGLLPTSVVIPAGWRLRFAIAGADADTFDRWPADAVPTYTIERHARQATWIELPGRTR